MRWVDAQVHWQHPERGLIAPAEFMPLAEDTGMAIPIGRFVARARARRSSRRWRAYKPEMTAVAGNLSLRQLRDPSLAVAAERRASGPPSVDPGAIYLEVARGRRRRGSRRRDRARCAALKATGVRIAIDDFGSGASSLSRLQAAADRR